MTDSTKAFVAYTARDKALAQAIGMAVSRANALTRNIRYVPWEMNDVAGYPLTSPILDGIETSEFIVADITYLNPNVVYEVGFAIGSGKRAFLIRHRPTDGDKRLAQAVGIFDTLGYEQYEDEGDLAHKLANYIDSAPLPIPDGLDRLAPVYVVEPLEKDGIATQMTSKLKKARYRYRRFDPTEDARLSAVDAIRQVAASSGVMLPLLEAASEQNFIHNTRVLFVAGLADGMGKPRLILAHNNVAVPLDVRDSTKRFGFPADIAEHISNFSLEITDYLQQVDPIQVRAFDVLHSLSLGDPTAENEMTTLAEYFLPTDEYNRTLRGEVNLVVGRKGTGKTALWIEVRDRIREHRANIVVDLKPEGYQLLKLKEDMLAHLTEGASQHLLTAFWEYLILLEITYKILEKDRRNHQYNHRIREQYLQLSATYRAERSAVEGDFSERLLALSLRIAQDYASKYGSTDGTKLTTNQVTELVYSKDVRDLRDQMSAYLEHKEGVWVLFDNLDKGWSTHGVDATDATVLRCLIDAGRKLERDMQRRGRKLRCIVFIRNDVYEHVMQHSADYGKEMRATLDWTDSDLLREMLRRRLVSGMKLSDQEATFEQVWPMVCVSHYHGDETSAYMIERSLMRPRNFLKIFLHAKGFATNLGHPKITDSDLEKGIKAYSQDLLLELDHELTDVFPAAKELLYFFVDCKDAMSRGELEDLILSAGVDDGTIGLLIDFLLYYGILGIRVDGEGPYYIFDVNYDLRILQVRASRARSELLYMMSPAFAPALNVRASSLVR